MAFVERSPFSHSIVGLSRYDQMRTPRKLDFSCEPGDIGCDAAANDDSELANDNLLPIRPMRTLRLSEKPLTPSSLLMYSKSKAFLLEVKSRLSEPNLNPFTPKALAGRKRCRQDSTSNDNSNPDDANNNNTSTSSSDDLHNVSNGSIESFEDRPAKRLHLVDSNTGLSRYLTEFEEKKLLGTGEFGCVYLCTNRMDGCDYAIKKSNRPILPGSANERRALNEVFAHAVLGKHQNVVRYFTAWSERKHMLIQNEYCNGGSLQDAIEAHRMNNTHFTEKEIRQILAHLSEGLRYIHSHKLAHMDIKPGNVFINIESRTPPLHGHTDDSFEEGEEQVVYKFGDFGHVTSVAEQPRFVEEGDARYLAMEVFHDDFSNLTKADIFALGLTVFEAAGGGPLEKNGPEWHNMRSGNVPDLDHVGKDINHLIKLMLLPDPNQRPTALEILRHPAAQDPNQKTKEQLERELLATKTKSQILEKKNKALTNFIKSEMLFRDMNPGVRTRSCMNKKRSVGKTANRSHSTTEFGW